MMRLYNKDMNFKTLKKRLCFFSLMIMIFSTTIWVVEINSQLLPVNDNLITANQQFVWSTPKVVSSESDFRSLRPCITVDKNDNVHFVYQDMTNIQGAGLDDDIFHKMWNKTSETWSTITVLSEGSSDTSKFSTMAADTLGNIHVTWIESDTLLSSGSDTDILYCLWNATTNSWSTIELVSSQSTGNVYWIDITTVNTTVFAVWQDATNYNGNGADEDILYSRRFVNGTWTAAETVSVEGSTTSYYPDIEVDAAENVYVSWSDESNYGSSGSDWDIFYRYRNATTNQWSTTEVISSSSNAKSDRVDLVVVNNSSILFTWVDYANILGAGFDHDIFYRFWNGTANSWGDITLLTTVSTGDSDVPCIEVDSEGTIHLVWFDTTNIDLAGEDQDVFYSTWEIETDSWSAITVVSSDSNADSWRPKIAIDSLDKIHLVWQDRTLNYAGSGNDIDILYSVGEEYQQAAHLTIIDKPLDEVFTTTSNNLNLSWILSDINTTNPVYTITINDGIEVFGNWTSDIPILYSLSSLDIGNYTFQFEAFDGWGEKVSDVVIVIIESARPQWIDPLINSLIGLGVAIGVIAVSVALAIILRRRSA